MHRLLLLLLLLLLLVTPTPSWNAITRTPPSNVSMPKKENRVSKNKTPESDGTRTHNPPLRKRMPCHWATLSKIEEGVNYRCYPSEKSNVTCSSSSVKGLAVARQLYRRNPRVSYSKSGKAITIHRGAANTLRIVHTVKNKELNI